MSRLKFISRFTPGKLPEHIERYVYESLKNNVNDADMFLSSKYATRKDADAIKNSPDFRLREHYYKSKWATEKDLTDALKSTSSIIKKSAISNPNVTDNHLDIALNDYTKNGEYVRQIAANNVNLKDHHLDKALNDSNARVRMHAILNKNVKEHHLDIALNDKKFYVRFCAAINPSIKKHQLLKALNDNNSYVVDAAKKNPMYKDYFPNGHENV